MKKMLMVENTLMRIMRCVLASLSWREYSLVDIVAAYAVCLVGESWGGNILEFGE